MNRGPVWHWIFTTACCPPEQLRRPPASRKPLREHPHSCSGRSIVQEPRARRASPPRAGGSPQARSASHAVSSTSALPVRSLRGELPLPPAHVAGPPSRTWERHRPLLPPSRAWDHHCPRGELLPLLCPAATRTSAHGTAIARAASSSDSLFEGAWIYLSRFTCFWLV